MLETPHVVVGAALAAKVVNPFLAIPLSFASHFVLDTVPHWNPHISTEKRRFGHITKKSVLIISADVILALLIGTAISIAISYTQDPNQGIIFNWKQFAVAMLCCFAAVLPDVIEAPLFFTKYRSKFLEIWLKFQKSIQNDTNFFWGIITQVLTISAALYWIFG
ncbi:MAG: hypothetical protein NZM26_02655 [Patescibacteria group bacterium]|nr:hypothetical protein [Patescibacteria group bacterium]